MLPSAHPLRLSTMTSGCPPPDTTRLDSTGLGLDDDGTSARYFRPRSPCGASMSTARSLDLDDCLRTLPRRIPRTCRRPVGRARLGRRDLYYPHLLLVRVVFLSFRSHLPPLLLILRPSFVRYQYNTNTHSPSIQSTASHTASPISHLPSHLIHHPHLLSLLRILPPLRSYLLSCSYGRTHMLISSFSLSSLLSSLSHMQHASIWLAPCSHVLCVLVWLYGPMVDGRFVCSHGLFLCACRAVYFDTAAPDSDADLTCECLFNLNGRLQRMRNRVN